MKTCALCKRAVDVETRAVELVGGFFDPLDPEFFVMDNNILTVSYLHLNCLSDLMLESRKPVKGVCAGKEESGHSWSEST